jgi:hypothetical protein
MNTRFCSMRMMAKRWMLAFLAVSTIAGHAALTFVAREPFVGPGTLTSTSPGSNFSSVTGTFTLVRVGPSVTANAAPGWSADMRMTGSANYRGTINLTGAASTCGMWGAWIRVKALPPAGYGASVLQLLNLGNNVVMDFNIGSNGVISTSPYDAKAAPPVFNSPTIPVNTWVWLAVAWQIQTGNNAPYGTYGIRCMSMPLGGTLTTWGGADGLNGQANVFSAVNVGLQTGTTGAMVRVGCPSLYAMSNFSDIGYPADIIAPVEQSNAWYLNPKTGNDNYDGSTPSTAWQTVAKVNVESQYSGMLDSNAPGPGGGDVLTIDTSGGPLVLGPNSLTISTQGLKVQPASGQTRINCQAEELLASTGFTPTIGLTKTYQTADTQANIVAWENDQWMWHVRSATFGASAAIFNPQTNTTTTYASTGAALDAVPGSFYTDGTNLYIHPFNDTNPATDDNTYTRSINRSTASAVVFTAGNFRAIGFHVRKTTLVDQNDNDFGADCFQTLVLSGTGQSSSVEGGYFAYGDKHCFASTDSVTASSLLVLDTECEQGNPYSGYGSQTPFVSFSTVTTADNVHTYRGCTCLARSGLIGSTTGDPDGTGGDIVYSHNTGSGISFASITIDNCNFGSGNIDLGVANNLVVTNQTQAGGLTTYCANTTVQETTFLDTAVQMSTGATTLTMQNCLVKPIVVLNAAHPNYYGMGLNGTATIEGCTFDLTGLTNSLGYPFQVGYILRNGPLNLIFRNNAYVVPSGADYPPFYGMAATDTLTIDHNAYDLGAGTTLIRNYNNLPSHPLTFAQWQALGEDCVNSTLNADLLLQNDMPQAGSPLFNAGVDFGPGPDVTGTTYTHRDAIGAYEGSAAYFAPQSISGFAAVLNATIGEPISLSATTNAGLPITYTVVSGPAQIAGTTLSFTGTGTVTVTATQAGNSGNAPLTEMETISVSVPGSTDTPTLPEWALGLMAGLLTLAAGRALGQARGGQSTSCQGDDDSS